MLRTHHFFLLVALLVDGGTVAPQPSPSVMDAGTGIPGPDAGTVARKPTIVNGIRWPEETQLLATLDGRAIMAAHAAMQDLMARFAKEDKRFVGHCDYSPKAMDVIIFEGEGMYIVRINPRVDRCGWADPSFNAGLDSELYAVSPEGKVLARYPTNL
jgi:hypothetical protein